MLKVDRSDTIFFTFMLALVITVVTREIKSRNISIKTTKMDRF